MGGGLMQLVAYGAQDIYLTGNPQITFFKVVYRRHTNFSMECIKQTFSGTIGTNASVVTATISRNGDLISSMHLDVKLVADTTSVTGSTYVNWTNNTGHAYINYIELEIGGQRIDKQYGHWLDKELGSLDRWKEEIYQSFDGPEEQIKVILSHNFAYYLPEMQETFPDSTIITVFRHCERCREWWDEAGGFDITYPSYEWYLIHYYHHFYI